MAGYDKVVTGCASCTLMLKDYPKLFAGEPEQAAAEVLAKRVTHISEFVVAIAGETGHGEHRTNHEAK